MTPREVAASYLDLGMVPIPVPFRSKAAGKGWNKRTLDAARESLEKDFPNGKPMNVAVLLGEASDGIVDVDLDCQEAIELAPKFLPATRTFGRTSKPASHWIFHSANVVSAQYAEPAPRGVKSQMLVELRGADRATVFPGSVHPSGESIDWTDSATPIAELDAADLYQRVACLGAAVLLARGGMDADAAIDYANANGEGLVDHPLADTVKKWTTGKAPRRPRASHGNAERRTKSNSASAAKFDAAVAEYNRVHSGDWPKSGGTCPGCGHDGCFGTLADDPNRWCCFSASHAEPGLRGDGCFHGDALDLDAHAAGRTRAELLIAAGLLQPADCPSDQVASEFITDLGIANRFVKRHGENVRYVRALRSWFIWDGVRWVEDVTGKTLHLCAEVARSVTLSTVDADEKVHRAARQQEQKSRIAGALDLAGVSPTVALRVERLDSDPWLLTCKNGTLDLRTGLLRRHARGDLITKSVLHDFDPNALCPRWDAFLREVMANREELIQFLQRWAGYCLTGSIREHALVIATGVGCNGKSVFVEALMHVFGGEFATPAPPGLLLVQKGERHPTEILDMRGRRFVVASEVPKNGTFSEERLKWLTGGDLLKGRGMHKDFVTFPPTHKLTVLANHMPRVPDSSDGFWRRLKIVPFDVSFKGREDKTLTETLRAEAMGILAWAVRGCVMWLRDGLGEPAVVVEATRKYRSGEDLIARFLAEQLPTTDAFRGASLYATYKKWTDENGERTCSNSTFGKELRARGWTNQHTNAGNVWRPPSPPESEGVKGGEGPDRESLFTRTRVGREPGEVVHDPSPFTDGGASVAGAGIERGVIP